MYARETITEMNALSKQVFGTTSKWKKMVEKGVHALKIEDTTRLGADGTKETVQTAKLHAGKNGGELHEYYLKKYTLEEVKEFMLKVLFQRQENFKKLMQAQEAKKNVSEASGSSV